jgi:GDP-4-dehydro-6-deoxy-D-mannose reductase
VTRLLVTGMQGFVGGTLSRMLDTEPSLADVHIAQVPPDLDLLDFDATLAVVAAAAPDLVIHLAAQTFVPKSMSDPEGTLNINVVGTLHLLQALSKHKFAGRLLFVGTGDVYGLVPETSLPIGEDRLPAPRNPYAVSKLAAEALCYQWTVTEGMQIVMARPFNHIGPGQSTRFAVADFARQLVDIEQGRRAPVLIAGDIDVTRDFTDVRDVVRAYFALLDRGVSGRVYNVCSGQEHSLRSLVDQLVELAGVDVRVEQDPSRLRKAEQRRMCGDAAKIKRETGWQATTPIHHSLSAMLDYFRTEGNHV